MGGWVGGGVDLPSCGGLVLCISFLKEGGFRGWVVLDLPPADGEVVGEAGREERTGNVRPFWTRGVVAFLGWVGGWVV